MDEYKCLKKINGNKKKKRNHIMSFINLCLITGAVFMINLILCKTNPTYKKFIKDNVYSKNFSFAKIEKTINKYLGSIDLGTNNDTNLVFNEKLNYISLKNTDNGVIVNVNDKQTINAFASGVVVFNGDKENYGKTLIVEQIDGTEAWYINIDTSSINIYDYIDKGSIIGNCLSNNFTMIFKKKGEIIDYKDYIS